VTPRQAIELMARFRGAGRRRARQRTAELIAGLNLEPWAATAGQQLSGGVRRLTAFCMAAAEPGRVVMLDEPTNDVDPVRRRLLWQQIRALADAGSAVLLVTHGVAEAELQPPFTATRPPAVTGRRVVVTIGASEAAAAITWAQRERAAGTVDEFAINPASLDDVYIGLLGDREEAGDAAGAA
jgi:ABC-2 type transport system ATP-binding protein